MFNFFINYDYTIPNRNNIETLIIEEIDEFTIEHRFITKDDAIEFADKLIKFPPVCDTYKVSLKTKFATKSITLHESSGHKHRETEPVNILSDS